MKLGKVGEINGYELLLVPSEVNSSSTGTIPLLLIHYNKNMSTSFIGVTPDAEIIQYPEQREDVLVGNDCIICEKKVVNELTEHWTPAKIMDADQFFEYEKWDPLNATVPICESCTTDVQHISRIIFEEHSDEITSYRI